VVALKYQQFCFTKIMYSGSSVGIAIFQAGPGFEMKQQFGFPLSLFSRARFCTQEPIANTRTLESFKEWRNCGYRTQLTRNPKPKTREEHIELRLDSVCAWVLWHPQKNAAKTQAKRKLPTSTTQSANPFVLVQTST